MFIERRHRRTYNIPGHAQELTFTCYRSYQFLKAERTCLWLAEAIEDARLKLDFALWAYVFMPEHVDLIVYPRDVKYEIADIRNAIKSPVGSKAIEYIREKAPHWHAQSHTQTREEDRKTVLAVRRWVRPQYSRSRDVDGDD